MISDKEHDYRTESNTHEHRGLRVESLENRNLLAADLDDTLSEAQPLGLVSPQPISAPAEISEATDVDMFRLEMASGQSVDIDVDTPTNGPGGLGAYLRVFNDQGVELAANNDAMAPDDGTSGFDPYLRFTAAQNGNYYIAVSNWENTQFDPLSGGGDVSGQQYSTGSYLLTIKGVSQFDNDDAMNEAFALGMSGPTHVSVDGVVVSDTDVDMFRIDMMSGQTVEFDIDTTQNGPGGLGSHVTLFDANGNFVAANNDAAAPRETLGFDAYLQVSPVVSGTYYLAVSNFGNTSFSPITGNGDTGGSMYATGAYRLTVGEVLPNAYGSAAMSNSGTSDQAAPVIESMAANSTTGGLQSVLGSSMAGSNMAGSNMAALGSDMVANASMDTGNGFGDELGLNSQVNEYLDLRSQATPPISGPGSAFGPLDASSMSLGAAAIGTSAFNFGPGQSTLNDQVDTRSAVATDMALMQSI